MRRVFRYSRVSGSNTLTRSRPVGESRRASAFHTAAGAAGDMRLAITESPDHRITR